MSPARRSWAVLIGLALIGLALVAAAVVWPRSGASNGPQWPWSTAPTKPEAEQVAHDPRNLPIGRYVFRTPEGTHGGSNGYGGGQFHIVVQRDAVHWFGRPDIEAGFEDERVMNVGVNINPVTERYGNAPRRPANDTAVITKENVLAFYDTQFYLRPLWLKDARGDHVEFVCFAGPAQFDALVESRSLSVLSHTTCRFFFRPRPDVHVMMQAVPGDRLPDFLARIEDVYSLVSNAIEVAP